MTKQLSTARRRVETHGQASKYIQHAEDALNDGDLVFICCRISRRSQDTLATQELACLHGAVQFGASVIDVATHVGSGFDPSWLTPIAAQAERLGAKLLVTEVTRFIRHPGYGPRDQSAQARESELDDLKFQTLGVPLVTLLHPDASSYECRAFQTRLGKDAKGKRGGRPRKRTPGYKKRLREQKKPQAIEMRLGGASLNEISRALNVQRSTVQGWVIHCFD